MYKNNIFWVTGATGGIGLALCQLLNQYGAKLIISGKNQDKLNAIKQTFSGDVEVLAFDLLEFDAEQIVQQAMGFYGEIDGVILNAGLAQTAKTISTKMSVEHQIMQVNYFANIALTKALVPTLKPNAHLAVVVSLAGKVGLPYASAYCASKHALYGWYESLAYELKTINLTLLSPGFVGTDMDVKALTENGESYNKSSKQKTITPLRCAEKMLKAIKRKKRHCYIGNVEILMPLVQFIFPKLFFKIISKLNTK